MGRNLWQTIQQEVRGGPMALTIFIAGLAALILSLVLTAEDFMSSLHGLESLQLAFGVQAVTWPFVLYFMAAAPQVGQIVFLALWSLDTSRKWALAAGLAWFLLDFISDVQFRSAGNLFIVPGTEGVANQEATLVVASLMTFLYFTVGTEMFMVAGSAIVLTLLPDARRQWRILQKDIAQAGRDEDRRKQQRGNNQQRQQRPPTPSEEEGIDALFAQLVQTDDAPSRREIRQRQGAR